MNFITKTDFTADYQLMHKDLTDFINIAGWPEPQTINGKYYSGNQIGLKCRRNAEHQLIDSNGSLYDKVNQVFIAQENDFSEWVDIAPTYTKEVIERLEKENNIKFGRIRYMRLMTKNGLSVHYDTETRYHYVLETNINSFFGEKTEGELAARCYHIPSDGYFYHVDTTRNHFVYNGGWEPRIHLVLNVLR